jgi:hypothetical protein
MFGTFALAIATRYGDPRVISTLGGEKFQELPAGGCWATGSRRRIGIFDHADLSIGGSDVRVNTRRDELLAWARKTAALAV